MEEILCMSPRKAKFAGVCMQLDRARTGECRAEFVTNKNGVRTFTPPFPFHQVARLSAS